MVDIPAKFIEALVGCRLACGSDLNLDVDLEVIRTQLELVGDDGLSYCPTDAMAQLGEERPYSEVWGEGRLLLSMLAQVSDDPRWIELGKRKVDRMLALTREKEGFRYLWQGRYQPGQTVPTDVREPDRATADGSLGRSDPILNMIYSIGALGHGAGLFARVAQYDPAAELARELARWALARMFKNDDGRYDFWHFHHGLYALMAVCEYGVLDDDREILERVDACYRWAREMGEPLVGFYSEMMPGTKTYLESQ